jgi:hypothetical protein
MAQRVSGLSGYLILDGHDRLVAGKWLEASRFAQSQASPMSVAEWEAIAAQSSPSWLVDQS